jgi:flagellar motor protein MotB
MAGKGGGGSWKVAYADFVTAMMAFFLVMWIGAQDQKVKQAVANYFVDPSGSARTPAKTGSTFESMTYGAVAHQDSVAMGKGRNFYTSPGEASKPTKKVNDYFANDAAAMAYWKEQATRQREAAAVSPDVAEGKRTTNEVATHELAKQMRSEMSQGVVKLKDPLHQDLVLGAINEVNWTELAEDMMQR